MGLNGCGHRERQKQQRKEEDELLHLHKGTGRSGENPDTQGDLPTRTLPAWNLP